MNRLRIPIIIILFFFKMTDVYSQDTLPKLSMKNLSFLIHGGLYYQGDPYGEVILPEYQTRDKPSFDGKYYVGDVPLFHGAAYLDVGGTFSMSGFSLNARLLAEHSGQSYGIYNKNAIKVYHKYLASLDTGFSLFGHDIRFGISVGNYDDLRLQQGLTMYNVDAQGSRWHVSVDKLVFTFQKIGDLYNWIGLNIDDGNYWSLKFNEFEVVKDVFITPEYCFFATNRVLPSNITGDVDQLNDAANTYSIKVKHAVGLSGYVEYGQRLQENDHYTNSELSAFLGGVSYSIKNEYFSLRSRGEYRRYGKAFNLGYYDQPFVYGDSSFTRPSRYYPGSQFFYPIQLYERPFSQWAVYSEYQGMDVEAMTLYADLNVPIWEGIFVKGLLDWNRISAGSEEPFIYPFYEVGVGWQPFEGVYGIYSFTNRTMNLSKPYPTLYLLKEPTDQFTIQWNLRF